MQHYAVMVIILHGRLVNGHECHIIHTIHKITYSHIECYREMGLHGRYCIDHIERVLTCRNPIYGIHACRILHKSLFFKEQVACNQAIFRYRGLYPHSAVIKLNQKVFVSNSDRFVVSFIPEDIYRKIQLRKHGIID